MKISSKPIILLSLVTISSLAYADLLQLESKSKTRKFSERFIEPTSPILGNTVSSYLKKTSMHPEESYKNLLKSKDFRKQIATSTNTYFKTMYPGLQSFCSGGSFETLNRSQLTEVEHAAIPLEVLKPFHAKYQSNLVELLNSNKDAEQINNEALVIAKNFQSLRSNCGTAKSLTNLENKLGKACVGPFDICQDSKDLNHILNSAEVGYPRIQYSLNGYTRFVYNELLKTPDLAANLRSIYDIETNWINSYKINNNAQESFFGHVTSEATKLGMHPRDIFLILAYSMRNMPSLDIEFAIDAKKALLLETYFWAFKKVKNSLRAVNQKELIFPNYPEGGLGIYHYLTASLLSCEAKFAGKSDFLAEFLGMFSKLGYKVNKLYKAIDSKKWDEDGIKYATELAAKQGFSKGVDAGIYGGEFGAKVCGEFYDTTKDQFDSKVSSIRSQYPTHISRGYRRVKIPGSKVRRKMALSIEEYKKHLEYKKKIKIEVDKMKTKTRAIIDE